MIVETGSIQFTNNLPGCYLKFEDAATFAKTCRVVANLIERYEAGFEETELGEELTRLASILAGDADLENYHLKFVINEDQL